MRISRHEGEWYIHWRCYRIHSPSLFRALKILVHMRFSKEFRRFVMTPED